MEPLELAEFPVDVQALHFRLVLRCLGFAPTPLATPALRTIRTNVLRDSLYIFRPIKGFSALCIAE